LQIPETESFIYGYCYSKVVINGDIMSLATILEKEKNNKKDVKNGEKIKEEVARQKYYDELNLIEGI